MAAPTRTGNISQESFPRTSERLCSQSQTVNRVVLTLIAGLAQRFLAWLPDPTSLPSARPSPRTPEPRSSLQRARSSSQELLRLPTWVTATCAGLGVGRVAPAEATVGTCRVHLKVLGSNHWWPPACSQDTRTGLRSAGQRPQPGGFQAERSVDNQSISRCLK